MLEDLGCFTRHLGGCRGFLGFLEACRSSWVLSQCASVLVQAVSVGDRMMRSRLTPTGGEFLSRTTFRPETCQPLGKHPGRGNMSGVAAKKIGVSAF